jgi:hypothetical protein
MFGKPYTSLTAEQYDYAFTLAEHELQSVLCWCPKLYAQALAIKVALLLEGTGIGTEDDVAPTLETVGGEHSALVQEDEVFDTRRKYKIVDRNKQAASSSPAGQLQRIIDMCKPPLAVGALLASSVRGVLGTSCCGDIADKAEMNHGGQ